MRTVNPTAPAAPLASLWGHADFQRLTIYPTEGDVILSVGSTDVIVSRDAGKTWEGLAEEPVGEGLKNAFGEMEGDLGEMGIDLEQLLSQLAEMMQNMDGDLDLSELAKAMLTQDLSQLENLIRQAAEQAGTQRIENMLQVGFFSRRTTEQLGMEGAGQELEALAGDDMVGNQRRGPGRPARFGH